MTIEKKIDLIIEKTRIEQKILELFKQKQEVVDRLDKLSLKDVDQTIDAAHEFLKANRS
jgi:hypothetical protein